MATTTNARRDLYAPSEQRPKVTTKKRAVSPSKRSPSRKNSVKKPKKKLSQEEMSLLTYQSISLLLDAARMLDEAEKRAAPKSTTPARPVPVPKPAIKHATPSSSAVLTTAPTTTSAPIETPSAPAFTHEDHLYTSSSASASSSMAVAALTLLTEQPARPFACDLTPSPASPKAAAPAAPVFVTMSPAYTPATSAALPLISPSLPQLLRPMMLPAAPESLVPRPVAAMPIPAELADIAVPVAPRSVSAVPRPAVKTPRQPRQPGAPVKKRTTTSAQIASQRERQLNFGYADECRTRIPVAVHRWLDKRAKMFEKRKESDETLYADFYWK
ncbi:hypothetical protein PENTCL1PPCAC_28802 [Pristionchus entomophagus]|uniref:Uncharacterized protein n=1 Tax=Pristionchus entomophagus TaxID=358040 RepID=A0AAV5UJW8_9BILA|nr:hypothetical protein PENTCL1PPCAC_28802 [Pristionchus entomophagus]